MSEARKSQKPEPLEKKVWLSSPTMHGEEMDYVREAYDANWMSTVGANIDAIEEKFAARIGVGYGGAGILLGRDVFGDCESHCV